MLPSAGFFEKIHCPLFLQGFCERPFCQYKHAKDEMVLTASPRPPFTRAAATARNHLTHGKIVHHTRDVSFARDPCLLELERINKEIETVKCEVEKEQRRLSHYKSLQGDSDITSKALTPYSDSAGKAQYPRSPGNRSTPRPQKPAAARSRGSKYVVDNSKPRTNLEYDPLSNYAAEVRSSSSPEPKPPPCGGAVGKRSLKRPREPVSTDRSEPLTAELEDSDDGVLVIDVPPLEVKRKTRRPPKLRKASPEVPEDATPLPAVTDASVPAQACKAVVPSPAMVGTPDTVGTQSGSRCTQPSAGLPVNQGGEGDLNPNPSVLEDISKCLETLRSESEKIVSPPEMEVMTMDRSSAASQSSPVTSVSWALKDPPGEQNGNSHTVVPQVIKHELTLRYDEKHNSFPNTPESDQGILPLALKSSSHVQSNDQQVTSRVEGYWLPVQQIPVPCLQKTVLQISEPDSPKVQSMSPADPKYSDHPEPTADIYPISLLPDPSPSEVPQPVTSEVDLLDIPKDPLMHNISESAPKTDLSSGEDMNYSDMDLSDSDPMEECYRIFMEANQAGQGPVELPGSSPVEMSGLEKPPVLPPGPKKRVAHVSKHNEMNKSRQQVIVPRRGPGAHLHNPSRILQLQQKAAVLTTAIKGGQAFVAAATGQRKPVSLLPVSQPTPVQTTCVNIIPVGATIQLGSNVHFIIPDGNIALPVTPVPAHMVSPQQTALTPAKPFVVKRKPKSRPEPGIKVPHDVRQRYVNLFVEEFLRTSFTVQDAFEKALAEEKMVYDRSINKLKYLSVAVNSLKKLKNQSAPSVKASTEANIKGSRGKISLSPAGLQVNDPGVVALYEQLKEHVLSEAALKENGYPLQSPDKPASAMLYGEVKKGSTDPMKRICCRCGATFSVGQSGKHVRKEECNYHYGKVVENKVPGGVETRYSCCEGAIGTPGCQVFKLHVHDAVSLDGFVKSVPKPPPENGCPGLFALDCEMCYTTHGLELARVTVVNPSLQIIYDTFVKPDNEVIDYNTRFSGVSEEDLEGSSSSIQDVQEVLLSFISADTILIGHGLEKDLCALKLLHGSVVDLTAVFPHRLGLPHKRGLLSLTADYLRRIIQESVQGHDSGEDATACMELMLWKVKEDGKVKRW
ncbi:RNA exonuclease 1 homolog [Anguilla anguilla]|uniref:RNA exonuclease 1 homolog n=1 Tax=Anguilla anguilla TaxID=7936 RepID=UPI0015AF2D9A|nr:RNA exonuclease 1 homolog [Anguilla anguilla]